jgi:uncharacterized protein
VKFRSPNARRFLFSSLSIVLCSLALWIGGCEKIKKLVAPPSSSTHSARIPASNTPKLAIILDDVGADPAAVDAIFALSYPLTLSILPNHPQSSAVAEEAHRRGYEVMLHLPMESRANEAPETQQLRPGMASSEIAQILNEMLMNVPHAAGVNNHQGSRATSNTRLMEELMPLLRERNLFFIDSRTIASTVAFETAQRDGVRAGFRNVPFLDDVREESAIRYQLELAMHGAKEKGSAIAIGHPHPETLRVLKEILPQLQARGIELVHASALVH